jgi:GTPase SAR1 family protein
MRTADGFLLVFDVTNRKSYDEVPDFFKHICRAKENDNPPLLIAANKCDIEESQRKISAQEIEQLSTKFKTKCLETSAKQRKNVDQAFHGVVSAVLAQRIKERGPTSVQPTPGKKKCSML